ncbi:MAG: hypothetical protein ACYSU4_02650, partial [Planctomycetota bacterium]
MANYINIKALRRQYGRRAKAANNWGVQLWRTEKIVAFKALVIYGIMKRIEANPEFSFFFLCSREKINPVLRLVSDE